MTNEQDRAWREALGQIDPMAAAQISMYRSEISIEVVCWHCEADVSATIRPVTTPRALYCPACGSMLVPVEEAQVTTP